MKTNKFLLGLFAAGAMFASCQEDVIDNGQVNNGQGQNGKAFVSVSINIASDATTRAGQTEDGGFVVGSETENKISKDNSIFLFYDATGKWITSGVVLNENPTTENNETDHEDDVNDVSGNAYIVLQGPDEALENCAEVLTVVNYSDCESLKMLDKAEALALITTTAEDPANAGFLMTTSTYVAGGKVVNTTAITAANICTTIAEAQANPVKIYIERAAAKVDVKAGTFKLDGADEDNVGGDDDKDVIIDGVLTPVQVTVDGWILNGINESTYLSKQLDASWATTAPFDGWNWSDNFRSYWAMSTNWHANQTLTYHKVSEATQKVDGTTVQYCYENTVNGAKVDYTGWTDNHDITTILLQAHFEMLDDKGNATGGDFFKYKGVYYTEANYKALIMKQLKGVYCTKTETTAADGTVTTVTADLTADDITLAINSNKTLAGVEFDVTIADGKTIYKGDAAVADTDIEATINALPYVTETVGYQNGMCYYQVPIEHLHAALNTADGKDELTGVGVVRNHHYKLVVSAIKNIGEAVYNPDVVIDEIPPHTKDYYLAAELHVLSWHVVNQDVVLE